MRPGQTPVMRAYPVAPLRSTSALTAPNTVPSKRGGHHDLAPSTLAVSGCWRVVIVACLLPYPLEDRSRENSREGAQKKTERLVDDLHGSVA